MSNQNKKLRQSIARRLGNAEFWKWDYYLFFIVSICPLLAFTTTVLKLESPPSGDTKIDANGPIFPKDWIGSSSNWTVTLFIELKLLKFT